MTVAALTFWPLLALVVTAAATLSVPVLVAFACIAHREQRSHRLAKELILARRDANRERKWAQIAGDDRAIADALAERENARRLASQMLRRNDELEAEVARLTGELNGARAVMSRLNRPQLARLAHAIEAEHVRTQPMPKVPALTHRVPAIEAPARRRPVLA